MCHQSNTNNDIELWIIPVFLGLLFLAIIVGLLFIVGEIIYYFFKYSLSIEISALHYKNNTLSDFEVYKFLHENFNYDPICETIVFKDGNMYFPKNWLDKFLRNIFQI